MAGAGLLIMATVLLLAESESEPPPPHPERTSPRARANGKYLNISMSSLVLLNQAGKTKRRLCMTRSVDLLLIVLCVRVGNGTRNGVAPFPIVSCLTEIGRAHV